MQLGQKLELTGRSLAGVKLSFFTFDVQVLICYAAAGPGAGADTAQPDGRAGPGWLYDLQRQRPQGHVPPCQGCVWRIISE